MNWLALVGAVSRLATALMQFLSERRLIAAGEAKGRAAADRDHARAAAEAEQAMRAIAEKPASRDETIDRLERGKG